MTTRDAIGHVFIGLRWPLAVLYVLVVVSLFASGIVGSHPWELAAMALGLFTQALFCFASGNLRMLRPATFHRSWLPAGIAGGLAAVLISGMALAGNELLSMGSTRDATLRIFFFSSWIFWSVLFTFLIIGRDQLQALRRLVLALIGGSLLQLTATVSAHMLVLRRGGCLVGIGTGFGIACGASVLLWAFGPAILLLYFYESRKRFRGRCPGCGYDVRGLPEFRCPECGRPFTPHEVGLTAEELRARANESNAPQ